MKGKKIDWTGTMDDALRREFPVCFNIDVARGLGVSVRAVIRRARELGLEKDTDFREKHMEEIGQLISMGQISSTKKNSGRFRKGEHRNPDGEFKKGRRMTAEEKRLRAEKTRAFWQSMSGEERREQIAKSSAWHKTETRYHYKKRCQKDSEYKKQLWYSEKVRDKYGLPRKTKLNIGKGI